MPGWEQSTRLSLPMPHCAYPSGAGENEAARTEPHGAYSGTDARGGASRGRNAGLVRRLYAAFAARDAEALLDVVAPEIEFFGPTATVLNEGRCYRGHEGMRRYLRDAEALWQVLEIDPQKLREVGNHVVALGRVRARAPTMAWNWTPRRPGCGASTPA